MNWFVIYSWDIGPSAATSVCVVAARGFSEFTSESKILGIDDAFEMKNTENAKIERNNIPNVWESDQV